MKNINFLSVFVLLFYPLLIIILGYNYISNHSVGKLELIYFFLGYYVTHISVGIGLHRLWSHGSYKTNKFVEFLLSIFSAAALQGPAIVWASDHFKHHTYTDGELDPHSPKRFKNKIKGFFWSHIGWMLYRDYKSVHLDVVTIKKLGKNKLLLWQLKYYWPIAIFMHTVIPLLSGYVITKTILGAYSAFIFMGLGRAFQQQITFCVNSICHMVGSRRYFKGSARDVGWLAPFLIGENWHNFHHAFPTDYRNGFRWYQLDIHKWLIFLMYKLGLAWDLQVTANNRIQAKMSDVKLQYLADEWQILQQLSEDLKELLKNVTYKNQTHNFNSLTNEMVTKLASMKLAVDEIIIEAKNAINMHQHSSLKILKLAQRKLLELHKDFKKLQQMYY